jgi:hypothetical protein
MVWLLRWEQGFASQSRAAEGWGAGRLGSIPGTAADGLSA